MPIVTSKSYTKTKYVPTKTKKKKEVKVEEYKKSTKSKFGWCLENQHNKCMKVSVSNSICNCDCHK